MALPWLIGALVVGAVSAVVKAVNSDDNSSSSSNSSSDEDAVRRRRAAAEEQRLKKEKETERADVQAAFKRRGEVIGRNLTESLDGWMAVRAADSAPFRASLTSAGYIVPAPREDAATAVEVLLWSSLERDDELNLIVQNLNFFGSVYDVQLRGGDQLRRTLGELHVIAQREEELLQLKRKLLTLGRDIAQAS